jgi:hypothetical protein
MYFNNASIEEYSNINFTKVNDKAPNHTVSMVGAK